MASNYIRHSVFFLCMATLMACHHFAGNKNLSPSNKNKIPKDTIWDIKTSAVSGKVIKPGTMPAPKVVPAGAPQIVPLVNFRRTAGIPEIKKIPEELTIVEPGTGPIQYPVSYRLKIDTLSFEYTEPILALPPRFKDEFTCDVKYYAVDQGFNGSVTRKIIQDKHQNIWFVSGGLKKFDGTYFTEFNKLITKSGNTCNICPGFILEDSGGNIWFIRGGSDAGPHVLKTDGRFVFCYEAFNDTGRVIITHPNAILEDQNGNVWITTNAAGLFKYEPVTNLHPNGRFIHFTSDNGLISNRMTCAAEDTNGNIWFGSSGSGLCQYELPSESFPVGRFIHYTTQDGLSDNHITSLMFDSLGRLWVGTHGSGIDVFDRTKIMHVGENEGLGSGFINDIIEDRNGDVWIATHGGGVCKYIFESPGTLHGTFQYFTTENNLTSNHILSMIEDNKGCLWFGAFENEVLVYNPHSFKHITAKMGMKFDFLRSPVEDQEGNLWFGEERGGGLCKFDGKQFYYYSRNEGLCGDSVIAVLIDKHGNLWIGTDGGGLCKFDGRRFYHYSTKNGITDNHITFLLEDRKGNIWIGTENNGVCKFDGTSFTHISTRDGLSDNHITFIMEDSQGNLWFATYAGGVDRYDGKFIKHYNDKNVLPGNKIASLCEDKHGVIWLGITGNILSYEPGLLDSTSAFTEFCVKGTQPIKHLKSFEILNASGTKFLIDDLNGNIWLGTEKGIDWLITPQSDTAQNIFAINFKSQDGLKGDNPIINSALVDSRNRLLFGQYRALTILGLNDFYPPADPPQIRLNHIEMEQSFIDFNKLTKHQKTGKPYYISANSDINLNNTRFTSVVPYQNYPEHLELPHNINHLTFNYSAIDWQAPHKLRYQYMLEGSDDNWRPITDEKKAIYTNLSHGSYTFKIKAIGIANQWSDVFEYNFVIRPPWWLTWWAYTFYGFIIIAVFYAWRRYDLKHQQIKQKLELEYVQTEKLEELDKMKSRFYANISHEFRTPLTLILGPLQNLLSKTSDDESKQELGMMQRNARRLQRLINQLLSLSKLEAGKIKLVAKEENIVTLTRVFVQSFESYAAQKKIKLDFLSDKNDIFIYVDRDKIEKVLNNLLSNAFKFTSSGGTIKVLIKSEPSIDFKPTTGYSATRYAEIRVSDTGTGISPDRLNHIFERFYQADDNYSKDEEGSGIGLALAKELVELHHGIIRAESKPGEGTSIIIYLPYGKSHLKPNEIISRKDVIEDYPDQDLRLPKEVVEQKKSSGDPGPSTGKENTPMLLIVEDNSDLRIYIRGFLDHDYQVIEAEDGKDGLEKAISMIPDLIVSDIMMPNMNGNQLCKEVKKDERTSHIPVILLTARASMESKIEGLETGADDFITKPFESMELQVRIKNLIEQRTRLRIRYQKEVSGEGEINIPDMSAVDQRFLNKVKNVASLNMADPDFSIVDFAREVGMSRVQLHRKLRALVDQSASEFLMGIRLHRAAELLKRKTGNISEIAYDVGFNNPSYFTSNFRKRFGMSPTAYMNKR